VAEVVRRRGQVRDYALWRVMAGILIPSSAFLYHYLMKASNQSTPHAGNRDFECVPGRCSASFASAHPHSQKARLTGWFVI